MASFSDKAAQEKILLSFDFSSRLDTAETIAYATFYIRSTSGTDPDASSMVVGSSIISGGVVKTRVEGGKSGYVYELSVVINTSGGRTLFAKADFKVI